MSACRTAKSLVDESSKAFGHCAARPNDPGWDDVLEGAEKAIKNARRLLQFGRKQLSDRRGPFPTFAYGISYGGGQQVCSVSSHIALSEDEPEQAPGNLRHSEHNQKVLDQLHRDPCMVRLMRYADSKS